MSFKEQAETLLSMADVRINGNRKWDIQVHNDSFYQRVLSQGSLGLGESYMDGLWDCKRLDIFFYKVLNARLDKKAAYTLGTVFNVLKANMMNLQNPKRAFNIGEKHYDIGNDLYSVMLDKWMAYSCGYWKNAKTLDKAQELKLDLICKKLGLKKGMKLLDIGCGWGSLINFAAKKYGVKAVGVTVSKEQAALAREKAKGLPVEIRLCDYREVNGQFDHVASVGMVEHVGPKNYRTYMEVANRCLKDDGLFLLHTIGALNTHLHGDPWIHKYIFPDSKLPSLRQLTTAAEKLFVIEDVHNFGVYYDPTLMAWHEKFTSNWDSLKDKYDERFFRMWTYYLLCCAGSFRARKNQVWQIVLSKNGVPGGYKSVR